MRSLICFLTAAIALGVTTAWADDAPLAKDEVTRTLTGKTMKFKRPDGQYVSWTFSEGGYFMMHTPDGTGSGTWKVNDNGQFCVDLRGSGAASGCRPLYKTDAGYSYGTDNGTKRPIESLQ
jgi:hypothetical protein